MVPLARRNLLAEKTRLLMAVGGVAFAVFLILLVLSPWLEARRSLGFRLKDMPGDLWVTQAGAYELYHYASILPAEAADRIQGLPGIREVRPVIGRRMTYTSSGTQGSSFFFALPPSQAKDKLPYPATGRVFLAGAGPVTGGGTAGVETAGAAATKIVMAEQELQVAGSVQGFSFLNFGDAQGLLVVPGTVNFFLVSLTEPGRAQAVGREIEATVSGASAVTVQEFAARSAEGVEGWLPIIAVLVVIGFIVGTAVVGITIYTATIERAREYGVLKALGASNGYLYRVVLAQSLITSLLGFALGLPLSIVAARIITRVVSEFVTLFQWEAILVVLVVILFIAGAAALLPAHRIARIDPAQVFRA